MAGVPERYLRLGLRLGRHADGLVDAYYGPIELAASVAAERLREPSELVAEAEALLDEIDAEQLGAQRAGWLTDQLHGIRTYAGILAGEGRSYADEVEACYGIRPEAGSEVAYGEAHERLDELLPGRGDLGARHERWRNDHVVLPEHMVPALGELVGVLRRHTRGLIDLPDGEELVVDEVHDEPWWAFNYYLGALRSRVVVNVDVPTTAGDLVTLAGHEAYPGHHTEHAVKEQRLIRDHGFVEEAIQLVPTPQAVVSEGIAEVGIELILDDGLRRELDDALAASGIDADLDQALAIDRARQPLRGIGLDAALMIHEHGASTDDAQAHIERWALTTADRAAHTVRFVTDPLWRAYVVTYSAGALLCRSYATGDPARLRTLLTEQVRVVDLLAAHG